MLLQETLLVTLVMLVDSIPRPAPLKQGFLGCSLLDLYC